MFANFQFGDTVFFTETKRATGRGRPAGGAAGAHGAAAGGHAGGATGPAAGAGDAGTGGSDTSVRWRIAANSDKKRSKKPYNLCWLIIICTAFRFIGAVQKA